FRTPSRSPERHRGRSANQRFPQLHQWVSGQGTAPPLKQERPYKRLPRDGQARIRRQSAGPAEAWTDAAPDSVADRLSRAMPSRPRRRRSADEGMRMGSRYLATVRRAISTPSFFNKSTMRSSDNG